ncbi:MAG TPA: PQQ-binding-like beta-propeller repeat protein [Trebonia sp.]
MGEEPVLGEAVVAALRLAAAERPPGAPLTTGRVLSALARVDVTNDWQRIWLHTGDPVLIDLAEAPDPPDTPLPASGLRAVRDCWRWEGVPVSASLARALTLLKRLCSSYRLEPVPSGAMALALLADPASGATRALLRPGGLPHENLLELIQSDLLDTTLVGVGDLIAASNRTAGNGQAVTPAAPVPSASSVPPSSEAPFRSALAGAVPRGPRATAAARRGVRRRLLRWRVLSCLALALTVMAIFWHRQVAPSPAPAVLPPYKVPAVAHQMLSTADLPQTDTNGWLQMQDGPPDTPLFTGTGRFRADFRNTIFASAWQRTWVTSDHRDVLQVAAYVARNRAVATASITGLCVPSIKVFLSGTTVAGYLDRGSGESTACAMALRGRTGLVITVGTRGAKASTVALHLLIISAERQLPMVPAIAKDQPLGKFIATDAMTAYNTRLMVIVVAISALLGLVTVVRDRSSWRRLRSWLSVSRYARRIRGRDDTLGTVPVDPLVSVRIARLSALALARIAVIVWSIRLCEHWDLDVRTTAGVVGATIVGILAAEWLIRRRTAPASWRPAVFTGRRWIIAAASLLLSAAIAGAGVFLVVNGLVVAAMDTAGGGVSDYVAGEVGSALPYPGVALIALALVPFFIARRLGMRALRNEAARERTADLERHPVLMLRSFADDRRLLRSRRTDRASIVERLCLRRFERFEEVAAAALSTHGPVLALSQPKEKLPPPLGAVRRSFSMEDWQDRIRDLISSARLICVTVGRSQSLLWEIGAIRAAGALDRTIFLLPPTGKTEQRRRLLVLAFALGIDYASLDVTYPDRDVLAVVFPGGDSASGAIPVVISGSAPDDVGYEAAIGAWALTVTGDQRSFPADLLELSVSLASYALSGAPKFAAFAAAHPDVPAAALPDPKRYIYAPGKAPVYKPWSRRLVSMKVLPWALSAVIVPGVFRLMETHGAPTHVINTPYAVTALTADDRSAAVYAVLEGHLIGQLDFGKQDSHVVTPVTEVSDAIDSLIIDGHDAYYASTDAGRVGLVDLQTRRTLWVRSVPTGVRSPVVADGRLVVTSPATSQVIELDPANGHVVAAKTLPGTAYGVAAAGKKLYVTLARQNAVAELDAGTLASVRTIPVPAGPRDIDATAGQVWVECMLAHQLVPVALPARRVWLSVQSARISADAGLLAVQGMEWVSVLSPGGALTRTPTLLTDPASLVAERDGSIVVGYDSGEIDEYGPVRS